MWPDLVAVRLNEKKAFICEVTWSKNWSEIKIKLDKYADRTEDIQKSLHHWLGINHDFEVRIWYFVLKDNIKKIRERKLQNLRLVFTSLEKIKPWRYTHGFRERDGDDYKE